LENPRQSYNQADHFLAPALAGTPDHDGVDDSGVGQESLLDLLGEKSSPRGS
jgi:hypothetical protein